MSVNLVTGVGRVVQPAAASRPPADPASPQAREADPLVRVDRVTQQPLPPRFPWLSWLTAHLGPASKQPAPYGSVPPLGENIDQRV
ncbi:MAG: hypothetical protein Q8K96_17335 [Rubrivivax sp.]|nr:hypothetical protein [Rubrivivax sp.]